MTSQPDLFGSDGARERLGFERRAARRESAEKERFVRVIAYSNRTTSRDSANAFTDESLSRVEALVVACITGAPKTCEEVEHLLNLPHTTVSSRIRALVMKGRLAETRERRVNVSGRNAIVWRVATATDAPPPKRKVEAAECPHCGGKL